MVARTRRTNFAARSIHAGEPSVWESEDRVSASTSRRHAESASSSRGTRVSELQRMLTNLTNLVTGLIAQQAVILRQTQPVCAVLPLPPIAAVPAPLPWVVAAPAPLPSVVAAREPLPQVAAAPVPPPPVTEAPALALPATTLSIQTPGSSQPPRRPFRLQEVHQNPLSPCPLPQSAFLPPTFPPFLARRDPLFPSIQAPHHGPDPFFGPMDGNAPFADAIELAPIPEDFRPPRLEAYRGATDPCGEAAVRYRQPDEATKCHLLANTLKGAAFSWFIKLPRDHISSYEHLKWELIAHFIGQTRMVISDMVLANIKQGERESLRDYTNHFFAAAAEAEDVDLR
ncbi:hypothetical protein AXF42_Ash021791 [Apostasia shenzhenica]|uniref:Retrotransposon gag domain-containing protein n=1 Tax=Apostasia shenzhenica TaxID=1088818 RepID=A0A2H9ZY79_9ASPA|nr:hypothetical protein AXF42_Ash021791 [Apostasia shenzhenica]